MICPKQHFQGLGVLSGKKNKVVCRNFQSSQFNLLFLFEFFFLPSWIFIPLRCSRDMDLSHSWHVSIFSLLFQDILVMHASFCTNWFLAPDTFSFLVLIQGFIHSYIICYEWLMARCLYLGHCQEVLNIYNKCW